MEYKHGGIWGMIFGLSRAFSGTIWVHREHDACFRKTSNILLKYEVKCFVRWTDSRARNLETMCFFWNVEIMFLSMRWDLASVLNVCGVRRNIIWKTLRIQALGWVLHIYIYRYFFSRRCIWKLGKMVSNYIKINMIVLRAPRWHGMTWPGSAMLRCIYMGIVDT